MSIIYQQQQLGTTMLLGLQFMIKSILESCRNSSQNLFPNTHATKLARKRGGAIIYRERFTCAFTHAITRRDANKIIQFTKIIQYKNMLG